MDVWEKLAPYRKREILVHRQIFATHVCPDGLAFSTDGEIVGALANDERTFFYLKHRRSDNGFTAIPQFKEPIVPHSLACDDNGNPAFGMTKDGRVITLDGALVATSDKGDKMFYEPDLRTQDFLEKDGKFLLQLPIPVYSYSIRCKHGMPARALAADNQTVFSFEEMFLYVIPEACLEKLLEK